MAILPDRPGIQVSVRTAGSARDTMEYDHPAFPDRPNSATKYIEAVDGADFSVVIKFTARNSDLKDYSLGLCIYVDGTRVQGSVIDLKAHQFARECWYVCDGALVYEDGKWVQRALRFEGLDVDKNARDSLYHTQFERVRCVGEITAKFYRVQEVGRILNRDCPSPTSPTSPTGLTKFNKVSEKALNRKSVSHQACTGNVKRTFGRCGRVLTEQIDPTDEPWAEFTFRYRSYDALGAEGLLSPPSTPAPYTTFDFLDG